MIENKENFVISTPKACDAFQSQFYRPTFCCHCFLKLSEHSNAYPTSNATPKGEREKVAERKKLLLPAGFEATLNANPHPNPHSSPSPSPNATANHSQSASNTPTLPPHNPNNSSNRNSGTSPRSANRTTSPRLTVSDAGQSHSNNNSPRSATTLTASGQALSPRLYTQGASSTVQSPVRELGLSPQKSARLFRKLSQRSLVSDMVAAYEVKEKARAETLSPQRSKTVGTVPSKESGSRRGWNRPFSSKSKDKVPEVIVSEEHKSSKSKCKSAKEMGMSSDSQVPSRLSSKSKTGRPSSSKRSDKEREKEKQQDKQQDKLTTTQSNKTLQNSAKLTSKNPQSTQQQSTQSQATSASAAAKAAISAINSKRSYDNNLPTLNASTLQRQQSGSTSTDLPSPHSIEHSQPPSRLPPPIPFSNSNPNISNTTLSASSSSSDLTTSPPNLVSTKEKLSTQSATPISNDTSNKLQPNAVSPKPKKLDFEDDVSFDFSSDGSAEDVFADSRPKQQQSTATNASPQRNSNPSNGGNSGQPKSDAIPVNSPPSTTTTTTQQLPTKVNPQLSHVRAAIAQGGGSGFVSGTSSARSSISLEHFAETSDEDESFGSFEDSQERGTGEFSLSRENTGGDDSSSSFGLNNSGSSKSAPQSLRRGFNSGAFGKSHKFSTTSSSSDWDDSSSGDDVFDEEAQTHSNPWMDSTRELLLNGLLYLHGCKSKDISKNEAIAFQYFTKAHEMSHPRGSYKVAEFLFLRSSEDCRPYFAQSVDNFCLQTQTPVPNEYYGESDFEYMFNDFRNGITKYPIFYEVVAAKHQSSEQYSNHHFLKKLIHFADSRRGASSSSIPMNQSI